MIAEHLTSTLGAAVERARQRRNEAINRDEVDVEFRRAANVLERFLSGQAAHETSESTLIEYFDRVGATR